MRIINSKGRRKDLLERMDKKAEAYALRDALPLILSEISGVILEGKGKPFAELLPALRVTFRQLQNFARCQDPENGADDVVVTLRNMIDTLNENARYTRRILVLHTETGAAIYAGRERVTGYRLQVIPLIKVKQHKQTEVVNSGNRLHLLRSDGRTMCGCVVGENWQRDVEVRGTWCKRCNQ